MTTGITLKQTEQLPVFLQEVFKCIDAKDFEGVKRFYSEKFTLYFAHYVLKGVDQGIGFVGQFDHLLPKYQHVMNDIFDFCFGQFNHIR